MMPFSLSIRRFARSAFPPGAAGSAVGQNWTPDLHHYFGGWRQINRESAARHRAYSLLMPGPSGSADIAGDTVHPAQRVMTLTVIFERRSIWRGIHCHKCKKMECSIEIEN